MANPKGNLAGYTDPEEPGWQDRVLEAVRVNQSRTKRWSERKAGQYVFWDPPFRHLLKEAARRRGLNMTGYCRRAIAAFVTHDLGATPLETFGHMPRPTEFREGGGHGRPKLTQDDGKDFGQWKITGLDEW